MKQFVKALDKRGSPAFRYLFLKFPKLSESKIKAGVFDGPQIREAIKDKKFMEKMDADEKKTWEIFNDVSTKVFGNNQDPQHAKMVETLVKNFQKIGCLMSYKVHLLHSHYNRFPKNCVDFSDEQGERFHQDIKEMEKRYQGFWDEKMLADYCWLLHRDTTSSVFSRNSLKRSFFERSRPLRKRKTEGQGESSDPKKKRK